MANSDQKPPAKQGKKSPPGQAMVEFMLVLPVMIVLMYGIVEVSRLVFIFASVSNASRQARVTARVAANPTPASLTSRTATASAIPPTAPPS